MIKKQMRIGRNDRILRKLMRLQVISRINVLWHITDDVCPVSKCRRKKRGVRNIHFRSSNPCATNVCHLARNIKQLSLRKNGTIAWLRDSAERLTIRDGDFRMRNIPIPRTAIPCHDISLILLAAADFSA
jgi:hypothetical protein